MYEQVTAPIVRTLMTFLDQDGDGAVTAEEYSAAYSSGGFDPDEAADAFARLDLNSDGRLSIDEIMTLADQYFRGNDRSAPGNALFGPLGT
jgi:Ca2+-binding EF-hand superfamily protein